MSYSNNTSIEDQIVSENGQSEPVFSLVNVIGSVSYFVVSGSPEGIITAKIGDIATDTLTGVQYIKTAIGSIGWIVQNNTGYSWFIV